MSQMHLNLLTLPGKHGISVVAFLHFHQRSICPSLERPVTAILRSSHKTGETTLLKELAC
jgi:hypothetical protein